MHRTQSMPCNNKNEQDEDKVISILLNSSDDFKRFHEKEWKVRNIPTHWCLIHDLENEAQARRCPKTDPKEYCIDFRNCPTLENLTKDLYIFAHEMTHIIRFHENKDLKISTINSLRYNRFPPIAKGIVSHILEDTAVKRFLCSKYKFNLLPHYEETISNSRISLEGIEKEPQGLKRTELLLQMIKERILWGLIKDRKSSTIWTNYETWLLSRPFSSIIEERNEVVSMIQEIEWDTREQQRPVFELIVDKCKLGDMITC